jgi:hypothetical protein
MDVMTTMTYQYQWSDIGIMIDTITELTLRCQWIDIGLILIAIKTSRQQHLRHQQNSLTHTSHPHMHCHSRTHSLTPHFLALKIRQSSQLLEETQARPS